MGCYTDNLAPSSNSAQTPQAVIAPEVTTTQVVTLPNNTIGPVFPDDVNPLTGLTVADISVLNRRPIVVKISNSPALVRPQFGIGQADLVYEHYTEVGVTRFSAIFYSNASQRVGSIRSARLIDYELVPMYQALLAFAGASTGVDKRIYGNQQVTNWLCIDREDKDVCANEVLAVGPAGNIPPSDFVDRTYKGILYGEPFFFRDEEVPVPHNLYVNLEALWQLASTDGNSTRPDLTGMVFSPTPPPNPTGSAALGQIRYLTTMAEWYYDHDTNKYYRVTDGQNHFDAETEQQISADNVVIVYAGHYLTDIVESGWEDNIHWSEQITLWPEGRCILLRDGLRYDCVWQRPARNDLLSIWGLDGQFLPLKPGNTWFQVVRLPEQMDTENEWVHIE
jgi:hypothetical protein